MKVAPLLFVAALAILIGGCGTRTIPVAGGTEAGAPEINDEVGIVLAAKPVEIPGMVAPAPKADPAAEMNGVFGGLIGGDSARRKAYEGKNGEELKILLDQI